MHDLTGGKNSKRDEYTYSDGVGMMSIRFAQKVSSVMDFGKGVPSCFQVYCCVFLQEYIVISSSASEEWRVSLLSNRCLTTFESGQSLTTLRLQTTKTRGIWTVFSGRVRSSSSQKDTLVIKLKSSSTRRRFQWLSTNHSSTFSIKYLKCSRWSVIEESRTESKSFWIGRCCRSQNKW